MLNLIVSDLKETGPDIYVAAAMQRRGRRKS